MTTQTKMTTTTVAAGVATMDHGMFPGIRDAMRSQEFIYWHTPSGMQTRKDRYRDRSQHNFRYREYRLYFHVSGYAFRLLACGVPEEARFRRGFEPHP